MRTRKREAKFTARGHVALIMAMYALATIPLIKKLKGNSKQIWYADDAAAIGRITDLREWWDHLTTEGPGFGYFPNPSKTWLVTKEGCYAAGISTFTIDSMYLRNGIGNISRDPILPYSNSCVRSVLRLGGR